MGSTTVIIEIVGIVIALVVVVVASWRIARKSNDTGTIQGFGTQLYGNKSTPNGLLCQNGMDNSTQTIDLVGQVKDSKQRKLTLWFSRLEYPITRPKSVVS